MAEWCGLCRYEDYGGAEVPCIDCVQSFEEIPTEFSPKRPHKPKATRADRVRASTDEELARFMVRKSKCPDGYTSVFGPLCVEENGCEVCWLDWLRQEATT